MTTQQTLKIKLLSGQVERALTLPPKEYGDACPKLDALLWEVLDLCQDMEFQTLKGLRYSYYLKGYEMFVDRKDKSLTKATVLLAFHTALELRRSGEPVTGPKKLKTFGASYLFPIFIAFGILQGTQGMEA